MIARIWHGKTLAANGEAYTAFLRERAIPDYSGTPGFKGLSFLRQLKDGEAHFTLITYWENLDVIRRFAGEEVEKAKYYPEDAGYLLEYEERVTHHEVFAYVEATHEGMPHGRIGDERNMHEQDAYERNTDEKEGPCEK